MTRVRGWAMVPASIIVALCLLLAALSLGTRLSAVGTLPGLPKLGRLDYSVDAFARLNRLTQRFVDETLGSRLVGRLGGPGERAAPSGRRIAQAAPAPAPVVAQAPAPAATASREDQGALTPFVPIPGGVEVHMTPTANTVPAGGTMTYVVSARNIGPYDLVATYLVSSHAPLFTTYCLEIQGETPCLVPGTYDGASSDPGGLHLLPLGQSRLIALAPGASRELYTIRLTVNPAAPEGTVLHNHAHVTVVGDFSGVKTTTAPDVTVRGSTIPVAAPVAAAVPVVSSVVAGASALVALP